MEKKMDIRKIRLLIREFVPALAKPRPLSNSCYSSLPLTTGHLYRTELPRVCIGERLRDFSIARLSSLIVRREKTLLDEFRPNAEGKAAATCSTVSPVLLILSRNFRKDENSAELSDDDIVGKIVAARILVSGEVGSKWYVSRGGKYSPLALRPAGPFSKVQ
jgi:hypothetical protein